VNHLVSLGFTRFRSASLGRPWSLLVSLGFTWLHLVPFCLIWFHLISVGRSLTRFHSASLGRTWFHLVSLGLTWSHLKSHGLTREKRKPPELKREKGRARTQDFIRFPPYKQIVCTHTRTKQNQTISRLDSPPNLRYIHMHKHGSPDSRPIAPSDRTIPRFRFLISPEI